MRKKEEGTISVGVNLTKEKGTTPSESPNQQIELTVEGDSSEEEELVKVGQHLVSQFRHNVKEEDELIDLLWDKSGMSGETVTREEKVSSIARSVADMTGAKLEKSMSVPDRLGLDLTPLQWDILGVILQKFSENDYHGERQVDKSKVLSIAYNSGDRERVGRDDKILVNGHEIGGPYKNIQVIPSIRITPTELMEGLDRNSRSMYARDKVLTNFDQLGNKKYLFMWKRLKKDNKGKPVMNFGQYKKEIAMENSSLFRIISVFDDSTEKRLLYYEITPTAVILDQITPEYGGNHFLLLPSSWTEQVKKLTNKNGGPFVYIFLLWLRSCYETIRSDNTHKKPRSGKKTPVKRKFEVECDFENLCQTLGVPESTYKNQRKRTLRGIERAYTIAMETGYLTKVEDGTKLPKPTDKFKFFLNESFYPNPEHGDIEDNNVPTVKKYVNM